MITKERFQSLQAGDVLVMRRNRKGNVHRLVCSGVHNNLIKLRKSNGKGHVVYHHTDLKNIVVGVFSMKEINSEQIIRQRKIDHVRRIKSQ